MCARYEVSSYMMDEVYQIVRTVDKDLLVESREISPTESAPVIAGRKDELYCEGMKWGFSGRDKKGVVFNARSEGADEKPMFRESLQNRRCVIPAVRFFEWNKNKEKVTFSLPGSGIIYLGGLYRFEDDGPRFTMLTTAANAVMKPVHDRMPLIIDRGQIGNWIHDSSMTKLFLKRDMPELCRSQEYEQQSLFN
ncbi:MAG: SOS response-associated peptidase [Lachnospiraceae bacterium]|nr:SOS response-associated peptidase [Lachnospiraceae bacterium]